MRLLIVSENWVAWVLQSSDYLEVWLRELNHGLHPSMVVGPFLLSYFSDVIHLSKVYNSVAFSVFAELCNDHHYRIPEHFLSSLWETLSG